MGRMRIEIAGVYQQLSLCISAKTKDGGPPDLVPRRQRSTRGER